VAGKASGILFSAQGDGAIVSLTASATASDLQHGSADVSGEILLVSGSSICGVDISESQVEYWCLLLASSKPKD